MLPRDFPPRSTVQRYLLSLAGRRHLVRGQPATAGRGARGRGPRGRPVGRYHRQSERKNHGKRRYPGFDAGKKVKGRKRHILTDTGGLLVAVVCPRRRDPGPRRRAGGVRRHPPPLSPPAPPLRRRRLCRAQARGRTEADRPLVAGDRQPSRGREGASNSCPADGSSSARSAWLNRRRTTRRPRAARPPGRGGRPFRRSSHRVR